MEQAEALNPMPARLLWSCVAHCTLILPAAVPCLLPAACRPAACVCCLQVVSQESPDKCQWLKARQRSAFPPNFIHSIDSTHMMMTALACRWGGGGAGCTEWGAAQARDG